MLRTRVSFSIMPRTGHGIGLAIVAFFVFGYKLMQDEEIEWGAGAYFLSIGWHAQSVAMGVVVEGRAPSAGWVLWKRLSVFHR